MRLGELERPRREDVHFQDQQAAGPRGADEAVRGVGAESGGDDRGETEKPGEALILFIFLAGSQCWADRRPVPASFAAITFFV